MGRNASGVLGIRLAHDKDEVIGMICLSDESQDILVVSENGYGKKSKIDDYRITNRGGKGVKTLNITPKTGDLIAIKAVFDSDDLMIINRSGIIIRMAVSDLRTMGRATQGVRLINIREGDSIASVARVEFDEETEAEQLDNNTNAPEENLISDQSESDEPNETSGSENLEFES
ncbi:MAG: DNA gyrase C-terminal beta-propeller domain-containing protein [Bacteroidales bacterium]